MKDNSVKVVATIAGLVVLCFALIIASLFATASFLYLKQSEEMKKQEGTTPGSHGEVAH